MTKRTQRTRAPTTTLCEDILYAVAEYLDRPTLITLRGVSHAIKDKAETLLVRHIAVRVVNPCDRWKAKEPQLIAITSPDGRLPMFLPKEYPSMDAGRPEKPRYRRRDVPFSKRKVNASGRYTIDINRLVHTEDLWNKLEAARTALSLVEYEVKVADWQYHEDKYLEKLEELDKNGAYVRRLLAHCRTVDVYYPEHHRHGHDDSGLRRLLPNVQHLRVANLDDHCSGIAAHTVVIRNAHGNWPSHQLYPGTRRVLINPFRNKVERPAEIRLRHREHGTPEDCADKLDEVVVLISHQTKGMRGILLPVLSECAANANTLLVDVHGSCLAPPKSRPLNPEAARAALHRALDEYMEGKDRPRDQLAQRIDRVQFTSWKDLSPHEWELLTSPMTADKIAQPKPPKPVVARKAPRKRAALSDSDEASPKRASRRSQA